MLDAGGLTQLMEQVKRLFPTELFGGFNTNHLQVIGNRVANVWQVSQSFQMISTYFGWVHLGWISSNKWKQEAASCAFVWLLGSTKQRSYHNRLTFVRVLNKAHRLIHIKTFRAEADLPHRPPLQTSSGFHTFGFQTSESLRLKRYLVNFPNQ